MTLTGVMCNASQCEIRSLRVQFGNVERNSHCDVLHITPVRVARLFLDYNGVFAIKAYIEAPVGGLGRHRTEVGLARH